MNLEFCIQFHHPASVIARLTKIAVSMFRMMTDYTHTNAPVPRAGKERELWWLDLEHMVSQVSRIALS